MDRVELKDKRKEREKHFLNPDGTITAFIYDKNIHFLHDGKYEDIDNTLVDHGDYYENLANDFHAVFSKKTKDLVNVKKGNYYLKFFLDKEELLDIDKCDEEICYHDLKEEIDFSYKLDTSRLKESIILRCKEKNPEYIDFKVDTNLSLELKQNKKIVAKDKEEIIFTIEAPYMYDAAGNYNYCIYYEIVNSNVIRLHLDTEWLKDKNTPYPVVIDPTIINGQGENVYDTFISQKNSTTVYDDSEKLELGVSSDDVKRVLIKYVLPEIGTGYDIINATGYITTHQYCYDFSTGASKVNYTSVHEITESWDETTATWANLYDKYNPRVEDTFSPSKNGLSNATDGINFVNQFNITNLVKRWYAGKPNNGIMLKFNKEIYDSDADEYQFYSKTYDAYNEAAFRSYMTITYRNQNGLEEYMSYKSQIYSFASTHVNVLTGNLVSAFNINQTIGRKMPISLNLISNTNDIVLNNDYGIGLGCRWNFLETIKEVAIDGAQYLEYCDGDGTLHYFVLENGVYIDEDGLGYTAMLADDKYVIVDSSNNKSEFTKFTNNIWYLTKISSFAGNENLIIYDSQNRITQITDANNENLYLDYQMDKIIVSSTSNICTINYSNNRVISIENKQGTTALDYNSYGLIEKINDVDGTAYKYEYYDVKPYKISKVTEIGLNETVGEILYFEYGFNLTRIKNDKGQCNTFIFNDRGNTIGISNLDGEQNLTNAYGQRVKYFTDLNGPVNYKTANKPVEEILPVKFTKNLISDSSFEDQGSNISQENVRSGLRSCEISNTGYSLDCYIPKTNCYYTFSGYFKNSTPIEVNIMYVSANGWQPGLESITIPVNEDFERHDFSVFVPQDYSTLNLTFSTSEGSAYMDDIQLEEGEVANYYNLVENADFTSDFTGWTVSSWDDSGNDVSADNSVITLASGNKAAKLISAPNRSVSLNKTISISGKRGDIYNLSFWYKNTGIQPTYGVMYGPNNACTFINFNYTNEDHMGTGVPFNSLNYNSEEWQFYSGMFIADGDYDKLVLNIMSNNNANELYITNVTLSRDIISSYRDYDLESGNLISEDEYGVPSSVYTYDENNKTTRVSDANGNGLCFEYEKNDTNRIKQSKSELGITTKYKYDSNGSVIKQTIQNVGTSVENGNYYIRLEGTEEYLFYSSTDNKLKAKEEDCNKNAFLIEKNESGYIIRINGKYLTANNSFASLNKNYSNNSIFDLEKQDNGSYLVSAGEESENSSKLYAVLLETGELSFSSTLSSKFFFESAIDSYKIETINEYDETGKFLIKKTDSLGYYNEYIYDTISGLLKSEKNASGFTLDYEYDEKDRFLKLKNNEREINYVYNNSGVVSKIVTNNKNINIGYDAFLNESSYSVNDNLLSSHEYLDSKKLKSKTTYGNGSISTYSYDDFDRITNYTCDLDTYNYYYDNLGNLSKIASSKNINKYYYDLAQRLQKVEISGDKSFISRYTYDESGNISNKKYQINDNSYSVNYEYNNDNSLTSIYYENDSLIYSYDDLGRLKSIKKGDFEIASYEYYNKGKNASFLLKSLTLLSDTYNYYYDKAYNITEVYLNNELINSYKYDEYNQLVKENDYLRCFSYKYTYDVSGNIISKIKCALDTDQYIDSHKYKYDDLQWKDLLTSYNNVNISYDQVGNPLKIGNANLTWKNCNFLTSYEDVSNNLLISYEYNVDGIRTSKTVNGVKTNFYLENTQIVIEESNKHMIYYIWDSYGNPIGCKHNDKVYYYVKNYADDIIALIDSENSVVCKYQYDSWGKLLSVKDNLDQEIKDINHIGHLNGYRYRSYYYDNETKLYYLNTRYYSPELCRFLNADITIISEGLTYNMFAYAKNNPIINLDKIGNFSIAIPLVAPFITKEAIVGAVIATVKVVGSILVGLFAVEIADVLDFFDNDYKQKRKERLEEKVHCVYTLNAEDRTPKYAGRTNDLKRREKEHKYSKDKNKRELTLVAVKCGLTYDNARNLEEAVIIHHNLIQEGYNKIHSISPRNPEYMARLKAGSGYYYVIERGVEGYEWP